MKTRIRRAINYIYTKILHKELHFSVEVVSFYSSFERLPTPGEIISLGETDSIIMAHMLHQYFEDTVKYFIKHNSYVVKKLLKKSAIELYDLLGDEQYKTLEPEILASFVYDYMTLYYQKEVEEHNELY